MDQSKRTWRRALPAIDALAWVAAVPASVVIRFDFDPTAREVWSGLVAGVAAGLVFFLIQEIQNSRLPRFVAGSVEETFAVARATAAVGLVGLAVTWLLRPTILPRSTFAIATVLSLLAILATRVAWRIVRQRQALQRGGSRTLIYGAGELGQTIARLVMANHQSEHHIVGFLDDDPTKAQLKTLGLRVLGSWKHFGATVREHNVNCMIVAVGSASAPWLRRLDAECSRLGVSLRVVPSSTELLAKGMEVSDLGEPSDEELMGRRAIKVDEVAIRGFIAGRRVLITGAGGSIGSELARQVARYAPESIGLLDRDESGLHSVQLSLDGSGNLTSSNLMLADVRDSDAVNSSFRGFRPDVVFHAAALKHLPLLERYPAEALKTNVVGTRNVIDASIACGVKAFVNVSTDKAADPISVLGYSKLITERMTAGVMNGSDTRYVSVRFGNVLGSRGSVLDAFRHQIEIGGPVTVTDPEVTRFFMTVGEAVHLLLQAAVEGESGETLILDMGEPVRILEIAEHMIRRSGREIPIAICGLRQGEKLHESLVSSGESASRPGHPLVQHVRVKPISHAVGSDSCDVEEARQWLEAMARDA